MNAPFDNQSENFIHWLGLCEQSFGTTRFVKLTLGNYKGKSETGLKKITIRPVVINKQERLSVTRVYKTHDIVKNYSLSAALHAIQEAFAEGFRCGNLFTCDGDFTYERAASGRDWLQESAPTHQSPPSQDHDRQKKRPLSPRATNWLQGLGLMDKHDRVLPSGQDKYRQINRYVELLAPLIRDDMRTIVDMGAGKGYLTFALYDYMTTVRGLTPAITGIEQRQNLVDQANRLATDCAFDQLQFLTGTIANADVSKADVLIALHACDTATDDAIAKGINTEAKLIVVAPCCHKQIRREMDSPANRRDYLLKHGIFLERQAEMVTDAIRALILERFGYRIKVFEFIASTHTAKNIMITATHDPAVTPDRRQKKQSAIADAKARFGIQTHYLETLVGGDDNR